LASHCSNQIELECNAPIVGLFLDAKFPNGM
jgi:hypothetical protein